MSRFSRNSFLLGNSTNSEGSYDWRKGSEGKSRAVSDAERLYRVAESMYQALIAFNWVIAIAGGVIALLSFAASSSAGIITVFMGVVVLLITGVICMANYVVAVLSTHVAKVLSNISLSMSSEIKAESQPV